ncbi:MAG: polymer-forming cytoskeletal protein [Candidatus Aminicenantes bacterium]|nr:polymer-forming cytoskeletal protein [Candidatus Aminicenantes bacterium]
MPQSSDPAKSKITASLGPETTSLLGQTLVCTGQITGQEDLLIKGTFKGIIRLKNHSLVIDKNARVEADIIAGNVSLAGDLTGNIRASGTVFVSAEAKMKGDITAAKVSIQDGAQFRGSIKMEKGA